MSYQAEIAGYINIVKRGRNFIFVSILASLIIGSAISFSIPPVYRAQATLYYLQAQIPEGMLISFVNVWLEAAVQFVESSIFTRDKCLEIIKEINLYPGLANKVIADDLVAQMKAHFGSENMYVNTAATSGSTQEVMTGVKFYFEDSSPRKAFDVATILASAYIENYRKFRESFATVTSSFLLDEQLRLKEEIAKIDKKIAEFKAKHITELPELFEGNYRAIEALNQRLLNLEQEVRLVIERKILLQTQLDQLQPFSPMEGISGARIVTPEEKLASLKTELAILQNQVSEKHPDIIRVQREIEGLEKIVRNQQQGTNTQNDTQKQESYSKKRLSSLAESGAYNPAYISLISQLDEADAQLQSLNKEKKNINSEIGKYQKRIEASPLIEEGYNILIRDRDTAQGRYESLVTQALEADSSAAMEKRDVGGKFVLTEPPAFPFKPIRPNRLLIIGTSLVIGIIAGFLIIFSWELLNQKIRSPLDLSKVSTFPVLLELPEIPRNDQKKTNNIRKLAIPLIILFMVPIGLLVIIYYNPFELDIKIIRVIDLLKKQFILLGQ
jgi:polysaccharide chain length determinant protein (PEP-CTERM system associated)